MKLSNTKWNAITLRAAAAECDTDLTRMLVVLFVL